MTDVRWMELRKRYKRRNDERGEPRVQALTGRNSRSYNHYL
jgi:hypothetical protein